MVILLIVGARAAVRADQTVSSLAEAPLLLSVTAPGGRDRGLAEDVTCGIRQLVDIALRALSPGVNDPTTAADVVQHLKLPLREILRRDQPSWVPEATPSFL